MLTVVTLNWARPGYLLRNLHQYGSYGIVDRVICFNNGPPLFRASRSPASAFLSRHLRIWGFIRALRLPLLQSRKQFFIQMMISGFLSLL